MITENQQNEIRDCFIRILNNIKILDKIPRNYGGDVKLHLSEINTIEMLGDYSGINVTEFAKKQGITKGAVSQMINRLAKKNLAMKYNDEFNKKEVKLKLTKKGELIFHQHKLMHLQFEQEFFNTLENITEEQSQFLLAFLFKFEHLLKNALNSFK